MRKIVSKEPEDASVEDPLQLFCPRKSRTCYNTIVLS